MTCRIAIADDFGANRKRRELWPASREKNAIVNSPTSSLYYYSK